MTECRNSVLPAPSRYNELYPRSSRWRQLAPFARLHGVTCQRTALAILIHAVTANGVWCGGNVVACVRCLLVRSSVGSSCVLTFLVVFFRQAAYWIFLEVYGNLAEVIARRNSMSLLGGTVFQSFWYPEPHSKSLMRRTPSCNCQLAVPWGTTPVILEIQLIITRNIICNENFVFLRTIICAYIYHYSK